MSANFEPNQNEYKNLTPFKTWLMLQINTWGQVNFPFVESDFDELTNYGMMMKLMKSLNDVISNENKVEQDMTNLFNAFTELQEYVNYYFDSEFPEKISEVLDEYVEDGTLERLLNNKLNLITAFDTYEEMIENSSTFVVGMKIKTLGYYEINDEGASDYYITDISNDNYQIELENGLFAELIILNDSVNVHQFGAKSDNITDNTTAIKNALSSKATNIYFGSHKKYMVKGYEDNQATGGTTGLIETTGLIVPSNKVVDLNYSTIKVITNGRSNYNIFTIKEVHDVILKNGTIEGDRKFHTDTNGQWGYGVSIRYASNITLENLTCKECWGDGININNNGNIDTLCKNIYINKCICDSNRRQGMSIENGENIFVNESQFINTGNDNVYASPSGGVDIEPLSDQYVINVKFNNCIFDHNYGAGIIAVGKKDSNNVCHIQGVEVKNSSITRNTGTFAGSNTSFLLVENLMIDNITIENNYVGSFALRPFNNFVIKNSNFINVNILLYAGFMNYSIAKFINNYFYNENALPYNALIESVDSPSGQSFGDGHNTLEVINNNFINKFDVNVQQSIKCTASARFNKLIAKNNLIKYGVFGIRVQCGCIIDSNNFIAQKSPAIYIGQGTSYDVSDIRNNVFEETSFGNQFAGAIYNTNYGNNLILQDNTLYQNCLNIGDQVEKTYSCSRFSQNTSLTGITLDDNNNIFDNSIS